MNPQIWTPDTETPLRLNFGCGRNHLRGFINCDLVEPADTICNIYNAAVHFPHNSASEIYLSHVLEHLDDPLAAMSALWKVARPNCRLIVRVPYGGHDSAFEDPTHVRQYFEQSMMYFGQPAYANADYGYRADWQEVSRTFIWANGIAPDDIEASDEANYQAMRRLRNLVSEMVVVLRARKPMRSTHDALAPIPTRILFRDQFYLPSTHIIHHVE